MASVSAPHGVEPRYLFLPPGEDVPNHPKLPVLIYEAVLPKGMGFERGQQFARRFAAHGWGGLWRNGIFAFPHFHTTAHEVLGIAEGRARLRIGGIRGEVVEVRAGDALVLPAGTGHECLAASSDLLVVGAYPPGQVWDLCRAFAAVEAARRRCAQVPLPATDPLFGATGPLIRLWRAALALAREDQS